MERNHLFANQSLLDGIGGKGGGTVEVELLHEAVPVLFHRLQADAEEIGDLPVLAPLGDEFQHLPLPGGEPLPGRDQDIVLPALQVAVDDLVGDVWTQIAFSRQYGTNSRQEFLMGRVLEDIAGGPGAEAGQDVLLRFMDRQDQDFRRRRLPSHLPDGVQASQPRHGEIQKQEIRLQLPTATYRLPAVCRLPHDSQIRARRQERFEPLPEDRVIFGDDDSFLPFRLHSATGSRFILRATPEKHGEAIEYDNLCVKDY